MSTPIESNVDTAVGARRFDGVRCAVLAAVAFAFLVWRAHGFFPNADGLLGHDYSWFLPTLLAGHNWNLQNGWLTLPHFTAAMCGGLPFLANPQSVFFSAPQLLLHVFEPITAMFATLLLSAAVGGAGAYLLLRRHFQTSVYAATLGATLFLLNGFLFYRLVVGHLTYHALAVVPWLACVVASSHALARIRPRSVRPILLRIVLGGALVAYVTYSGALNFQIPIILTVACTLVMLQIRRGFRWTPWLVLLGCSAWGLLLSAMKVIPGAIYVAQFPRPYVQFYLFKDPLQLVDTLLTALFVPAMLPEVVSFPSGAGLTRHEFEFGLSIVPPVILITALFRGRLRGLRFDRWRLWLVLAVLLLVPIAVTSGPYLWGRVLVRLPIINNNTTLVRWWALYLLPIVIVTAHCFDVSARASRRGALLVCCLVVAIAQNAAQRPPHYVDQAKYDPRPITNAYHRAARGELLPPIDRIVRGPGPPVSPPPQQNDAFITGVSTWPCYEPIFGYYLDLVRDPRLVSGPITLIGVDGRLNLVDPSAYFARPSPPEATWRFEASRLAEAVKFAAHRPFEWRRPWWYDVSVWLTLVSALVSLVILVRLGAEWVTAAVRG